MKKHLKYLSYIIRHKWFVFVACMRIGASPWLGIVHDLSKLRPSEWIPYCRYFYGGPFQPYDTFPSGLKYEFDCWRLSKEYAKQEFDIAWLHHQHRNPHHWQYWILREDSGAVKVQQMPRRYMFEMVADWMGAGRAITGRWETREWYDKNKDKMQLHPETQRQVEAILYS